MSESSGPAAGMTDSMSTGTRRCFPRTSKSRTSSQLNVHLNDSGNRPTSDPPRLADPMGCDKPPISSKGHRGRQRDWRKGESPAQGLAQMRYPRTKIRELRVIPATMIAQWKELFKSLSRVKCPRSDCWCEFPSVFSLKQHYQRCQGVGLAFRLRISCPSCEAVFISKAQLQKHLVWNHSDRGGTREQRPKQSTFDSGGKEREAGKSFSLQRHSRQAVVHPSEENGDVTSKIRHIKQRADEDPGRMKHRRKQKTPKKFTGEQPSITGAFALKGLGKAEDKSRRVRGKVVKARKEDPRKRMVGTNVRRENTLLPGSAEDACQRQIIKRGEVTCPNCASVTRKTMAGLRKHMEVCEQLQEALRCQHCRKQFKSKAGLNYHTMAEHMNKDMPLDEQKERERLRKVLKQLGKLRCAKQDCSATFSSLVGYQYHTQRCGREANKEDKLLFSCPYCSKEYQSKAGRNYHVRSEHCMVSTTPAPVEEDVEMVDIERTPSGRVRRQSAQLAVFHLQEIAEDELAKDGSRRRMKEDLVPDSKRLNYLRPGLPTFNPQLLENWKMRVKEDGFICCPNNCCEAIYSSVSGLKAHLANCSKGNHLVGKYRCLLCQKEFSSESGVKYHILKTHSQNWFRVSSGSLLPKKKATLNFSTMDSETVTEVKKRKRRTHTPIAAIKPPALPKELPSVIKTHPVKLTSKPVGHSHNLSFRGTSRKGFPTRGGK